MNPSLSIAKTGLEAQDMRMRVISNNLANVGTAGFKRDRADFAVLAYQNIRQVGAPNGGDAQLAVGLALGTGVRVAGTTRIHAQGNLSVTTNALDLAVEGNGFFQVLTPDGKTAYTRDGAFTLDGQGRVVTSEGYPVQPGLQVPQGATNITIATDGTVSATAAGATEPTEIGQIQLAQFINPPGLQPQGTNLLTETPASGAAQVGQPGTDGLGQVRQGSIEASNVNMVEELVDMIETQRAYEVNSKVVKAADEMMQQATQMTQGA
jgi:flagellar basal-body rod protein FlgG